MRSWLKPALYKLAQLIKWYGLKPVAVLIGRLRSPQQVVFAWPQGEVQLGPRVVLFMHFDGRGLVRPQLLDYIRELKANGRDIVFVSNAKKLKPQALRAVQEVCAAVLVRRNIGYDFGAWADAVAHFSLPRADTEEIIFANDSVFGPMLPLGDMLRRLNYAKADILSGV